MQIAGAGQGGIVLSDNGDFLWNDEPIGKVTPGDSLLKPKVELLCGDLGSQVLRDGALGRLADFIRLEIEQKLSCIFALRDFAASPTSYKDARALAHVMFENNGTLDGRIHHQLIREAESTARGHIVGLGGAFGFYYAYMRDLMKPAPARLLSILYVYAWAEKENGTSSDKPFFPANGITSLPAIDGYTEKVLNMAGYTRRGPRIIRFDILNRLGKLLFQARKERSDGRFAVKKEMLSLLGCSFEDFEQILVALKYRKTTQKFTKEEDASHKEYVLAYFARREAIRKAKEQGDINPNDFPPVLPKKPGHVTDKTHADYVPKRQRIIILNDHVTRPEEDADGKPVFQTHLELWGFGQAKKSPKRYKPSRQGSNDPDKENRLGKENGSVSRRNTARQKNVSDYAELQSSGKQAAQHGGGDKANRQNKRRKFSGKSSGKASRKPMQTSWAPPKTEGVASASPFAALAGLSFEDTKDDKPKGKNAKSKSKPKSKDKKA